MVDQDNIDQRCSFVGRAARYARIGPPRTVPTLGAPSALGTLYCVPAGYCVPEGSAGPEVSAGRAEPKSARRGAADDSERPKVCNTYEMGTKAFSYPPLDALQGTCSQLGPVSYNKSRTTYVATRQTELPCASAHHRGDRREYHELEP